MSRPRAGRGVEGERDKLLYIARPQARNQDRLTLDHHHRPRIHPLIDAISFESKKMLLNPRRCYTENSYRRATGVRKRSELCRAPSVSEYVNALTG